MDHGYKQSNNNDSVILKIHIGIGSETIYCVISKCCFTSLTTSVSFQEI